jgi:hypothetical protein
MSDIDKLCRYGMNRVHMRQTFALLIGFGN